MNISLSVSEWHDSTDQLRLVPYGWSTPICSALGITYTGRLSDIAKAHPTMERTLQGSLQRHASHTCSIANKAFLQQQFPQLPVRRTQQSRRCAPPCHASMGLGFQPESPPSSSPVEEKSQLVVPKSVYGLSTRQIAALGFTDPDVVQRIGPQDQVRAQVLPFMM